MSLLDQLSSLCMLSMETQTQSPLFSFSIPTPILPNPINNGCKDQYFNVTSQPNSIQKPLGNFQSSEKKMIKLFDDSQLQAKWRFVKTQKKPSLQPKAICLQSQKKQQPKKQQQKLSEFIVQEQSCKPQRNDQDVLIKLTKLNFMIKNKLRKINYEFFVKFQQYSQTLLKQKIEKQQQFIKQQQQNKQKSAIKLWETISIIHTKYVHQEPQQSIHLQFQEAFARIKSYSLCIKQLCTVTRIHMKLLKRKFLTNLQQINKRFMKVELFENILKTVMMKKVKVMFAFFVQRAQFNDKGNSILNVGQDKEIETSLNYQANEINDSRFMQTTSFIVIPPNTQNQLQPTHLYPQTITSKNPLSLPTKQKPHKPNCLQQPFIPITQLSKQQNIPLKLHSTKPHEQLYNLNDCIDNGHLLMNMVQSDKSFRQELQNLTISKINNNSNTTSSINSSVVGDQNFLLAQELNAIEPLLGQAPISMRKHAKKQTQTSEGQIMSMKHTKQPRKSLVVTNFKDMNGEAGSSKQKLQLNCKDKAKSTTNSTQKIPSKTKITIQNDRDVIKRMLDQLNKRFLQTDNSKCKIPLKNTSNKKQPSKNESHFDGSAKNTERKKVKSQVSTVVKVFDDKGSNKKKQTHSKNNSNSGKKQYYRIDLVGSSSKKQSQTKNQAPQTKKRNSSASFMSVTLNQSKYENGVLKDKREIEEVYQNLIERRFKQTRSELANQFRDCCENGQGEQGHNQEEENFGETSYFGSRKQSIRDEPYMRIDLLSNNGLKKKSHDITELKDESFLIKRSSNLNFSSDNDTTLHEYINYIPSTLNIQQHHEYYPQSQSHNYISQKPLNLDTSVSNIEQQNSSHYQSTLNKPSSINTSLQRKRQSFQKTPNRQSFQKTRQSFQKNRQQWDLMFQKQKSKFLNSSSSQKISKRKSTLNEEVIMEIRSKIEKCLVLNDKDTNVGVRDKCYSNSYGNSGVGSLGSTLHVNKKVGLVSDNQKVAKGTGVFSVKNSKQKKAVSTKLTTTSKFLKKLQS